MVVGDAARGCGRSRRGVAVLFLVQRTRCGQRWPDDDHFGRIRWMRFAEVVLYSKFTPLASPAIGAEVPDSGTRGIVALGVALIERLGVLLGSIVGTWIDLSSAGSLFRGMSFLGSASEMAPPSSSAKTGGG